ncbi:MULTISPECIES: DUF1435 family protein [Proteus]|uniref:DUF1435 family protein n=1 Tax=Proteus TaxID=583 RepID=UPI000BFC4905|nr:MULTISPECIES: DUF1435 family protein [Proteus]ATM99445.1 hypothetical protein CRN77_06760 [Proteus vulgaris]MBG2838192.1 DUF1435 family protein [Proteus terrae subsp. cibarius]MBG2868173.1 DUF1435 family protein [Proteus terrae subsp. cibarius]MBJ2109903.1 DUF1435 family protein [Proteus terrae]MBJ2134686.1 DUF1435 family protein [Proteus terrae]
MAKPTRISPVTSWTSRISLWEMLTVSSLLTVITHSIAGTSAFTLVLVVSMLLSTLMLFHKKLQMWVMIPAGVVLTYSLMTLLVVYYG